jgi:hypothetical protein
LAYSSSLSLGQPNTDSGYLVIGDEQNGAFSNAASVRITLET